MTLLRRWIRRPYPGDSIGVASSRDTPLSRGRHANRTYQEAPVAPMGTRPLSPDGTEHDIATPDPGGTP